MMGGPQETNTQPPPATNSGSIAGTEGLIEPGNIDIHNRPKIKNEDGSTSTVNTMTFDTDGGTIAVPGVDDKRKLTPDEAWDQYKKTGKHLGMFKDRKTADAYAQKLHEDQAKEYGLSP